MKKLICVLGGLLLAAISHGQVINGGFEDWDTSKGYASPVGWDNYNAMTKPFSSIVTCNQRSPGATGTYAMTLNTQAIPGLGIMPGFAVLGKLDSVTHQPVSGVPCTTRPQVFGGYWQYMPYNPSDAGFIAVVVTKWNTTTSNRDTLGTGYLVPPDMEHEWKMFQVKINYTSTATPDSAIVILSASGGFPLKYSYISVDDVWLGDSVVQTDVNDIVAKQPAIAISPNPAKNQFTLSYFASLSTSITVDICDIAGRVVAHQTAIVNVGNNEVIVTTNGIANGLYIVRVSDNTKVYHQKLIIE
jgi:hypothetical protein